ncbi:vacuolar import and degradation protein-domain-containing protein [Kockovaella imperatae]|uniref:Vacuolar import and degradation protein-domain-containing protein n=1 Tax=Kockovaella imperatae TaxID=4999 RepID=A0A1Y1UB81_9TREE|nr:vacuolar import and degradation protein-domain-containing protein [Kockovaella imperatae]ORX35262.1 vacuolar import and degradation protein-domain-containing protein [Kockovaella imperatae]
MPTESSPFPSLTPSTSSALSYLSSSQFIKCAICGSGALDSGSSPRHQDRHGVVLLVSPPERICGSCVRSQDGRSRAVDSFEEEMASMSVTDLVIEEAREGENSEGASDEERGRIPSVHAATRSRPIPFRGSVSCQSRSDSQSQSLPAQHSRQWNTLSPSIPAISEQPATDIIWDEAEEDEPVLNPLLDVTKLRVSSAGRGALFAGSIFRGTQTSGRSAYEVEVKFLDVNLAESTVSGYLSISHLTDAHPHLTTFFTGEIIGPKFGFLTGARYGATEHDDMRHWGRFEQFRRPSTRADILRPDMVFRDPLPDWSRGETQAKERDFVFLRLKERFLVPDHTVRDISGASFAGFYFAMIDLAPSATADETPASPSSPTIPKTALSISPTSPTVFRRMSSSGDRAHLPRRRSSSVKVREEVSPPRSEATIRGYYFHSLNQEPFQELFLTHVPAKSDGTFEMR